MKVFSTSRVARCAALLAVCALTAPLAVAAQSVAVVVNGPPPPTSGAALVYHWPTGTIYNHQPQLRFELDRPVRPGSFQASVDGKPVDVTISRSASWYYFAAPRSLPMGDHTVRVRGLTQRGDAFDVRWTFYQAAY
jgi:hypothetical protein